MILKAVRFVLLMERQGSESIDGASNSEDCGRRMLNEGWQSIAMAKLDSVSEHSIR